MGASTYEIVRRDIEAAGARSASSREYRTALIRQLRQALPIEAACCTVVDPATLLSTGAVTEDRVEAMHDRLFENEYLEEDYNKYARLAASPEHTATLSGATQGLPERSLRYRDILRPEGFGDELRAALVSDGVCWGFLTLFRRLEDGLFREEERQYVCSLVPVMAQGLRKQCLTLSAEEPEKMTMDTGLLVLSGSLNTLLSNEAGDYWLGQLRHWERISSPTLPRPIRAVASRARSGLLPQSDGIGRLEAPPGTSPSSPAMAASVPSETAVAPAPPRVCIRTPHGQFLSIRASVLSGGSGQVQQLGIWVEQAKPGEILPLLAEAYGLSPREKQILGKLLQGFSTKELAEALHISAYTVQDHMKSIFIKTGTASRRELVWPLLSRYSLPYGQEEEAGRGATDSRLPLC
ncbi:helix-turn-helix transcriptional regulator [Paenibacillus filicis]|uniref:Helix-turn-helix transcriptional regulator n=1 Tax=Paenibacillus filicis TaxID=669464 RepID=A0ABU9DH76_9BACL